MYYRKEPRLGSQTDVGMNLSSALRPLASDLISLSLNLHYLCMVEPNAITYLLCDLALVT